MPLFPRWRAAREQRRKAASYVEAMLVDPAPEDVSWLAQTATHGDEDHARWELRYAKRAIGFLVAQRDALDDRTGSIVARALGEAFSQDPKIGDDRRHLAERQFNARVSAYRDALAARPSGGSQLGQTLLAFSGGSFRELDDNVRRAADLLAAYERDANTVLRNVFGAAALPEHVPPSALAADSGR